MAGETFIKGTALIMSVNTGVTGTYRPIACLTQSSLSASTSATEVETMCDPGNVVKEYGSTSYTASVEGVYIDTTSATGDVAKASHDYLLDLVANQTQRVFRMATGLTDTPFYYFTGLITDLELTGSAGDNATFSATIEVNGGYVTTDPS